jgi:hypothetical protein
MTTHHGPRLSGSIGYTTFINSSNVALSTAVIASSPLLYYPMDESTATIIDATGNQGSMTATGSPDMEATAIINEAGAVNFVPGSSERFIETALINYTADGVFCVQAAFNVEDLSTGRGVVHLGDFTQGSNRGWYISVESGGDVNMSGWASSNFRNVSTDNSPIQTGTNYLMHVNVNTTSMDVYLNGTLAQSVGHTWTMNNNTTTPPFRIGCIKSTTDQSYFDGRLGHVALWNDTLTPQQIQSFAISAGQLT